jgi:hypothetical protein
MKNFFLSLIFILITGIAISQEREENTFQQSENQATGNASGANGSIGDNQVQSGPGNPNGSDEVPIDDYLPALVIIGATLIIYQLKSKKIKTL